MFELLGYLDPGSGAMAIQIIIAGILAASYYFRRLLYLPLSLMKRFTTGEKQSRSSKSID